MRVSTESRPSKLSHRVERHVQLFFISLRADLASWIGGNFPMLLPPSAQTSTTSRRAGGLYKFFGHILCFFLYVVVPLHFLKPL